MALWNNIGYSTYIIKNNDSLLGLFSLMLLRMILHQYNWHGEAFHSRVTENALNLMPYFSIAGKLDQ
jgi:hypothetical protein